MILGFSNILRNSTPYYYVDLPSFQRDFASLKTLDHGTGPAITFTRASNATYFDVNGVLQTAANDVPRFDHDPADGGKSLGLLIEEARTNFLLHSADLGNAAWVKSNVTATANNAAAPDGNTTAAKLAATSNNGFASQNPSSITATSESATASVFLKRSAGTGTITLELGEITQTCAVDSTWQRFSVISSPVTASATIASNVVTVTRTAHNLQTGDRIRVVTGSSNLFINFSVASVTVTDANTFTFARTDSDGTGNISYVSRTPRIKIATSGDEVWAWGGQLELGAFPTSYIPTTTAAATRSADSAVVTPISSFYNQAEGTLFAEYIVGPKTNSVVAVDLNDATFTKRMGIIVSSGGTPQAFGRYDNPSATTIFNIAIGSAVSANTQVKMAFKYAQNDFQAARDGTLGTADTAGDLPPISRLHVGTGATTGAELNGHIRKVAYWPKRLTNTLLQQLTT